MSTSNRVAQLDYLKCVFIVLMIAFHLVYIGDKYPYAKQIVYTFHMPAFLILSGYLANVEKKSSAFLKSMIWIFIPYALMESGYVLMSAILPVRERVEELTLTLLLDKLFLTPLGPYWYLHTLIVCSVVYYVMHKCCHSLNRLSFFVLLGLSLGLMSVGANLLSASNAMYFMIGVIVAQSGQRFLSVFQPSVWGIIPVVILCCYPENLDKSSLSGVLITYLVIGFFLWAYAHLPQQVRRMTHFIGANTLPILLFSPVFTIISKVLIPLFAFDSSGLCFLCVAVTFVLMGCFTLAWLMDRMKISRWFCGKNHLLLIPSEQSQSFSLK